MITTNVYCRTFQIRFGNNLGTCFTIDVDGRQYLVTAKHVIHGISAGTTIDIHHEGRWKGLEVQIVGHAQGDIDISVLAASIQVGPSFPFPADMAGLMYGQDVYFLGYPYGTTIEVGDLNFNFPMPFVKKAIMSCVDNVNGIVFLDGHNNPGFSGGPVVFTAPNTIEYKVAAVISGYRFVAEPVFQGDAQLSITYKYNTGIIISYGIKHAVDLIRKDPIGFELQS